MALRPPIQGNGMRIPVVISSLTLVSQGFASQVPSTTAGVPKSELRQLLDADIVLVNQALKEARKHRKSEEGVGEFQFFSLWRQGLDFEKAGNFGRAAELYLKASMTSRWEYGSHDVLLALGRVHLRAGDRGAAKRAFEKFISEAELEIDPQEPMPYKPAAEAIELIKSQIKFAKRMIQHGHP